MEPQVEPLEIMSRYEKYLKSSKQMSLSDWQKSFRHLILDVVYNCMNTFSLAELISSLLVVMLLKTDKADDSIQLSFFSIFTFDTLLCSPYRKQNLIPMANN